MRGVRGGGGPHGTRRTGAQGSVHDGTSAGGSGG